MRIKVLAFVLVCSLTSLGLLAAPSSHDQQLLTAVQNLVTSSSPDKGQLRLKRTELEGALKAMKQKAGKDAADQTWISQAGAAVAEANKILNPSLGSLIGSTAPMTAVLFSDQSRNSFEVVKNPVNPDDTMGIINQSTTGRTGGILIAAEAPFAYPAVKIGNDTSRIPIGAWFGVNLKTGGGDEVSDVDLAAGLSVSLISADRLARIQATGRSGLAGSAKLLLGVVYGEVASLGPKDATSNLTVGDKLPLGDTVPLHKRKEITFAYGIGFRF